MGYFSYQYLVKINTFFFFFTKIDREGWIITPRSNICSRYRRYWCPIFIVFLEPDGSRQAGSSCWKPGGSFSFFWFLLLSAGVRRTLRDSKTKSERLPGTSRTTQEKAVGLRGAGGGWGGGSGLPRRLGGPGPPPPASASGWTPRSAAPASGSPGPSGSAAPEEAASSC